MNTISELFEKSIQALDICNATRVEIEKIRFWQKHFEILLCSLNSRQRTIAEGQFHRAIKALMDLALVMLDEKEIGPFFPKETGLLGVTAQARITTIANQAFHVLS